MEPVDKSVAYFISEKPAAPPGLPERVAHAQVDLSDGG